MSISVVKKAAYKDTLAALQKAAVEANKAASAAQLKQVRIDD
jgi:hypothetical protein